MEKFPECCLDAMNIHILTFYMGVSTGRQMDYLGIKCLNCFLGNEMQQLKSCKRLITQTCID